MMRKMIANNADFTETAMRMTCQQKGDQLSVEIVGVVNNQNIDDLKEALQRLLSRDFKEVVFDLSRVPFITSSMIGKLLMFYKDTSATGRTMRIKGINADILEHFQTLRIDELFPVEA